MWTVARAIWVEWVGGRTAFIAVDVQNGFWVGGTLAVNGGRHVARAISDHLATQGYDFVVVLGITILTPPLTSVRLLTSLIAGRPIAWRESEGLNLVLCRRPRRGGAIVSKWRNSAGDSGFEGADEEGLALEKLLAENCSSKIVVATDECVNATALAGLRSDFDTVLRLNLSATVREKPCLV